MVSKSRTSGIFVVVLPAAADGAKTFVTGGRSLFNAAIWPGHASQSAFCCGSVTSGRPFVAPDHERLVSVEDDVA